MAQPIVFFDMAGNDDEALQRFYETVFDWQLDDSGQVSVPINSPISGAFRKDPTEKRLYVGVPDVTASLQQIEALGGSIDAPRFEVPGVVVLGLFKDPAGNEMGLVELDGADVKIP